MYQQIPDAREDQAYFLTAEVTLPDNAGQDCTYQVYTASDNLLYYDYRSSPQSGPVNASGIFTGAPNTIAFQFRCSSDSTSDSHDTFATLDNIALSVYDVYGPSRF